MDMNYALHMGMPNLAPSLIFRRLSLMDVSFVCSFWCFFGNSYFLDIFAAIFLSTFLVECIVWRLSIQYLHEYTLL